MPASPKSEKFRDVLLYQVSNAVVHLRLAAVRYGAQCVTNLRYHEPTSTAMGRILKISGVLVQLKGLGPDGPEQVPPMVDPKGEKYAVHRVHTLPEHVLGKVVEYEAFVEAV